MLFEVCELKSVRNFFSKNHSFAHLFPHSVYVLKKSVFLNFHGDILHVYFIQPETITQTEAKTVNNRNPSATSLGSHLSESAESDLSTEMQAPANTNAQAPLSSSQTDIPARQTVIVEPEKLYRKVYFNLKIAPSNYFYHIHIFLFLDHTLI